MKRPHAFTSRGFILVESSIVYVILSLTLVALLPMFILCLKASKNTSRIVIATQLSTELLEEIRLRRFDENTPQPAAAIRTTSPVLGPDSGESPGDKTTFNDVDDFHNWAEKPPLDPGMNPIKALDAYSRNVTVDYVHPENPDVVSQTPTDYKRVTVCTQWRQTAPVCLSALFTNR